MAEKDFEHFTEEDLDLLTEDIAALSAQMKQFSLLLEQQIICDKARHAQFDRIDLLLHKLSMSMSPSISQKEDNGLITAASEKESMVEAGHETSFQLNSIEDSQKPATVEVEPNKKFVDQSIVEINLSSLIINKELGDNSLLSSIHDPSEISLQKIGHNIKSQPIVYGYQHLDLEFGTPHLQVQQHILVPFTGAILFHSENVMYSISFTEECVGSYFAGLCSNSWQSQNGRKSTEDRNRWMWDPGGKCKGSSLPLLQTMIELFTEKISGLLLELWWRLEVGLRSALLLIVQACGMFDKMPRRDYSSIFFATLSRN